MFRNHKSRYGLAAIAACALAIALNTSNQAQAADQALTPTADREQAQQILKETGVTGGLVVLLGCGDGALVSHLAEKATFVVQGLTSDPATVEAAQRRLLDAGRSDQGSIRLYDGTSLPYVDNLVNAIIVSDPGSVSRAEMERVLAPYGALIDLRSKKDVQHQTWRKPWPQEMDEWTHHLHSPDNNAVSLDRLVGPPRGMRWNADRTWSRVGQQATSLDLFVSANGRVFHNQDVSTGRSMYIPADWHLIARDAFNGIELWRRPIADWRDFMIFKKSFPTVVHRRIAALGDHLFVTLGFESPVSLLDARTGETIHLFPETAKAEEILVTDDMLLVVASVGSPEYRTQHFTLKEPIPRRLVAIDWKQRRKLWETSSSITAMSAAMTGERVYYHDGQHVQALERATGKTVWSSAEVIALPAKIPSWYGPTLVAVKNRVLLTTGPENLGSMYETTGINDLFGLDANTGETVWKAKHYPSGYNSPKDVFVINNQVWFGDHAVGRCWPNGRSGPPTTWKAFAHDLDTGEKLREIDPDRSFGCQHNRCHRGKATVNFMMCATRGIDLLDLKTGTWSKNNWVRAQCNIGFTPANGLIYFPPNACDCFLNVLLRDFNALSAASALDNDPALKQRRFAGSGTAAPAWKPYAPGQNGENAPVYRSDLMRSGFSPTVLPDTIAQLWSTKLDGALSAPTVADGRVFVGLKDRKSIQALDAATGKALWRSPLAGGIDSPPTLANDRVYAGSRDGHIYCLRADDGRLIWRFLAAPNDRQMVSHGQVESVWPLNGSVLVLGDTVYALVGRSIHLDGGIRLIRLHADTGELLGETLLPGTDPKTGEMSNASDADAIGRPDLLLSDGKTIAWKTRFFDLDAKAVPNPGRSIIQSSNHFLDDSFFSRIFWTFSPSGRKVGDYSDPFGNFLAVDENAVFGYGPQPDYIPHSVARKYRIFRSVLKPEAKIQGSVSKMKFFCPTWEVNAPIFVLAMVKTKNALVIAGPDNPLDEGKPQDTLLPLERRLAQADQAAKARDNLLGKHGATLLLLDPENGATKQELRIEANPVFDGLIAANGRLYLATTDGSLVCLSKK